MDEDIVDRQNSAIMDKIILFIIDDALMLIFITGPRCIFFVAVLLLSKSQQEHLVVAFVIVTYDLSLVEKRSYHRWLYSRLF